jgi:hypothetical protein
MSKLPLVVEGPVPGVYTQVEDIGGFIVIPLAPDVPLEPDVPEEPSEPELPLVPEEPSEPELPLVPELPSVPLVPEEPINVSFETLKVSVRPLLSITR